MLSAETGRTPLFYQGGGRSNRECLQSTPLIKKWGFTPPPFCSPCCLYFGVGCLLLHRSWQRRALFVSFPSSPALPNKTRRARAPPIDKENATATTATTRTARTRAKKEVSMLSAETARTPLFSQGGGRSNRKCLQSTPLIKKWGFTRPSFCSLCCLYFGVGYLLLHRS